MQRDLRRLFRCLDQVAKVGKEHAPAGERWAALDRGSSSD